LAYSLAASVASRKLWEIEMIVTNRKRPPTKALFAAALAALLAAGIMHFLFSAARPATIRAAMSRPASAAELTPLPILQSSAKPSSDPWTADQTVQPSDLVKELGDPQQAKRPTIVCVAPHVLYAGGHIPGALYDGPGMNAQGINDLKTWAKKLPRSTNVVVYCGCCPLEHCPNLRPAFEALRAMGFTHLRALLLPTNFYTDWVKPGYPVEKGN
jgi:hypothetical protein